MKLTKKDKIMLLVLAVVGFVAMFYMLGIRPVNQKVAELTPQVETLTAQLNEKQTANQGTLTEMNAVKGDMERVLDTYYMTPDKPLLHEEMSDRVQFERMIKSILTDLGITGYPTIPFVPTKVEQTFTENGVTVVTSYKMWEIPVNFTTDSLTQLNNVIEYFRNSKDFKLITYRWAETRTEAKEEDGEGASDKVEYMCFVQVNFYMRDESFDNSGQVALPTPLSDIQPTLVAGTNNKVVFDKVEGARYYKAFYVGIDDLGNREYLAIDDVNFVENADGKMEAEINNIDGKKAICIQAVGDMIDTYKSLLNKATPYIVIGE